MNRRLCTLALVLAVAGCQQAPPPVSTDKPAPATAAQPPAASASPAAAAKAPRVEQLCRRHPEMGPCQYERDQCRARGGRVFTARNEEVTVAVEAEYDRVVRRVRFQGDSGKK